MRFGTDSATYAMTLYWSAKIALNAGNAPLATRLFNKCVRSKQHQYSAQLFLAILHLNSGKGPVRALFGASDKSAWPLLSRVADHLRNENYTAAR
jgi:hypothetical protein